MVTASRTHCARFTPSVWDVGVTLLGAYLPERGRVLDPFAGTGRIHELRALGYRTEGVEIEPEFAAWDARTKVADSRALPWRARTFDGVFTSPCYGNRFADVDLRPSCAGTYAKSLGRRPSPGSAGAMQWGPQYRELHEAVWADVYRVLRPGGVLVLNISDHYRTLRKGEAPVLQRVAAWHFSVLRGLGLEPGRRRKVKTPRLTRGANGHRAEYEHIAAFTKSSRSSSAVRP